VRCLHRGTDPCASEPSVGMPNKLTNDARRPTMRELLQALVILLFFSSFLGLHQFENIHSRSLPDEKIQFLSSENMSNQTLDEDSDGLNDTIDPCPSSPNNHCIKAAFGKGEYSPWLARGLWCGYPILLIFIWLVLVGSDPRIERDVKFDSVRKITYKVEKTLESGDAEKAMEHLVFGIDYIVTPAMDGLKPHHLSDYARAIHREAGENRTVFSDFFATVCDVLTIVVNKRVDNFEEEHLKAHDEIIHRGLEDEISSLNNQRELLEGVISFIETPSTIEFRGKNLDEARQALQRLESTLQLFSTVDTQSSAVDCESEESNIP